MGDKAFGRAVTRTRGHLDDEAREIVRRNFEATRAFRFPRWDGEPEINEHRPDPLGRFVAVGWYAEVPEQFVTDDAEEQIARLNRENARLVAEIDRLETDLESIRAILFPERSDL